jgi:hypothetical protein
MTLNRKGQPRVYTQMAMRSTFLDEEQRRAAILWDIAIGVFGMAFIVFLFGMLG